MMEQVVSEIRQESLYILQGYRSDGSQKVMPVGLRRGKMLTLLSQIFEDAVLKVLQEKTLISSINNSTFQLICYEEKQIQSSDNDVSTW